MGEGGQVTNACSSAVARVKAQRDRKVARCCLGCLLRHSRGGCLIFFGTVYGLFVLRQRARCWQGILAGGNDQIRVRRYCEE